MNWTEINEHPSTTNLQPPRCVSRTPPFSGSLDMYECSGYYNDNFSECMTWTEINEPSLHNHSPITKMCIQNTTIYRPSGDVKSALDTNDDNFSECMTWTVINESLPRGMAGAATGSANPGHTLAEPKSPVFTVCHMASKLQTGTTVPTEMGFTAAEIVDLEFLLLEMLQYGPADAAEAVESSILPLKTQSRRISTPAFVSTIPLSSRFGPFRRYPEGRCALAKLLLLPGWKSGLSNLDGMTRFETDG
jgi:hypothetical protein